MTGQAEATGTHVPAVCRLGGHLTYWNVELFVEDVRRASHTPYNYKYHWEK